MKVLSIVGARPQFVKLAPVAEALEVSGHQHLIVHTGQHYDANLSEVFFADLKIAAPNVHLGVGSGSHGVQTGAILAALDSVLDDHRPDWVLVYGDTNSTLAGAIAAVKMHLPVAHLEAGLRSFNRRMPEEHNRILTDHAADLCLAPTELAISNLAKEGLSDRSALVGDVMTDVCLRVRDVVAGLPPRLHDLFRPTDGYLIATIHRAENTDDPDRLEAIISALGALSRPVALLAHPRLVARAAGFGIRLATGAVHQLQPLSYPELVGAVLSSHGVITDSGGLQKESFLLGVPCTTLRAETEWPETLEDGWNVLDPDLDKVGQLADRPAPRLPRGTPFGDGHAAAKAVDVLASKV